MGALLVYLVFIGIVIQVFTKRKKNEKKKQSGPVRTSGTSSAKGAVAYGTQRKQWEQKQRLQQHFAGTGGKRTNDISGRAVTTVAEYEADEPAMGSGAYREQSPWTGDPAGAGGFLSEPDFFTGIADLSKGSAQMRAVSDLMITGYQPELSFERDFIAEGVEMLSSYGKIM